MTNGRIELGLNTIAHTQDGVFTHAQAIACKLTQRQIGWRVRNGIWVQVLPGVYRHAATLPTPTVTGRAAVLWAGDGAVLSHRSAASMWGLDGVSADPTPEITVVGSRHPRSDLVIVHRTVTLPPSDRRRRDGLTVTSPLRTIVDLASVLDDGDLESALESARRTHLVTLRRIERRLDEIGGRGRRGATPLRTLLAQLDATPPSESVLEVKVARLLRASGLPTAVRQHRVRIFGRTYRLDFAWPEIRLALECDGRAFHEFQRDRTRLRRLAASGWRVLPVTWNDVTHGWAAVEGELSEALSAAA
jgi:very-short-patch-repair endonuclease